MSDNAGQEPSITINGVQLTDGQAMTLRVALEAFDPDCGDDAFGQSIERGYRARLNEIRGFMYMDHTALGTARPRSTAAGAPTFREEQT